MVTAVQFAPIFPPKDLEKKSLLAGKFGKICTALPLATIFAKNFTGHPLKMF